MSGTHRDLLFTSKSRCFACKTNREGLGPIESCSSDDRHAVLLVQNHRWGLGPIETCNSCPKVALLNAQNRRSRLGPTETSISGASHAVFQAQNDRSSPGPIETWYSRPKFAVLHAKTKDEGWDPWRLVILVLNSLFCMHKTTGEVWDT